MAAPTVTTSVGFSAGPGAGVSSNTFSLAGGTTTGGLLIAFIAVSTLSLGPSTVTWNGVPMTNYAMVDISGGGLWAFVLPSPASGTNNLVVTWSAVNASGCAGSLVALSGVYQPNPVRASITDNWTISGATSTTYGLTNLASNSTELVVSAASPCSANPQVTIFTANQTALNGATSTTTGILAANSITGSGATSMTYQCAVGTGTQPAGELVLYIQSVAESTQDSTFPDLLLLNCGS